VNSVTAKKSPDGTTTIRFGCDPKAPNYLRIDFISEPLCNLVSLLSVRP
jgi:hypothetical protein